MGVIDLRRRPEPGLVDLILLRSEHLPKTDRALLEAYFRQGVSTDDLAALDGRSARSVRRRITSLCERVLDDMFVFVLRSRKQFGHERGSVAEAVYLLGQSRREAADALGYSLYVVRKHCDAVEALAELASKRRAA